SLALEVDERGPGVRARVDAAGVVVGQDRQTTLIGGDGAVPLSWVGEVIPQTGALPPASVGGHAELETLGNRHVAISPGAHVRARSPEVGALDPIDTVG